MMYSIRFKKETNTIPQLLKDYIQDFRKIQDYEISKSFILQVLLRFCTPRWIKLPNNVALPVLKSS